MEDVARELANPTNALGKLGTNFDFTLCDGTLPGASDRSPSVLFFQPALPVPLENGMNFFARPGIPVIFDQPVFNGVDFDAVGTARLTCHRERVVIKQGLPKRWKLRA